MEYIGGGWVLDLMRTVARKKGGSWAYAVLRYRRGEELSYKGETVNNL